MQQQNRSINDLLDGLRVDMSPKYQENMLHDIPETEVIDRVLFILERCMDKTVLDIGCDGFLHPKILEVAKKAYGVDRIKCDFPNFTQQDISNGIGNVPSDVDLIVCGEVVEHLSNPGIFLDSLKPYNVEKIFTVPNAFSNIGDGCIRRGQENVNAEHVAWYSYYTFNNLLRRHGLSVKEFYWCDNPERINDNGFNEGLVFVTN